MASSSNKGDDDKVPHGDNVVELMSQAQVRIKKDTSGGFILLLLRDILSVKSD